MIRAALQHWCNELHVCCRLRALGCPQATARRIAGIFGRLTRRLLYRR